MPSALDREARKAAIEAVKEITDGWDEGFQSLADRISALEAAVFSKPAERPPQPPDIGPGEPVTDDGSRE